MGQVDGHLGGRTDHMGAHHPNSGTFAGRAESGPHHLDRAGRIGINRCMASSLTGSCHHFDLSSADHGDLDNSEKHDHDQRKDEGKLDHRASPDGIQT